MIDEKGGGIRKIATQSGLERRERRNNFHGGAHVPQPGFAFGKPDPKGHMAHSQARMAPFLLIMQRAAKALDQEPGQVHLGMCQVIGVQGPQNGVRLNTLIKGLDKIKERLIRTDAGIDFGRLVIHRLNRRQAASVTQIGRSIPAVLEYNRAFCYKTLRNRRKYDFQRFWRHLQAGGSLTSRDPGQIVSHSLCAPAGLQRAARLAACQRQGIRFCHHQLRRKISFQTKRLTDCIQKIAQDTLTRRFVRRPRGKGRRKLILGQSARGAESIQDWRAEG